MVKRFRRLYGAGPRHLPALIVSLIISGAAVAGARGAHRSGGRATAQVPRWVYVRIPALFSGLLILVFFPEALRLGNPTFQAASGMTQDVYLSRLLLTCGAAFALSGLAYAISAGRRRAGTSGPPPTERTTPGRHDAAAKKPVSPDTPAP